MAIIDRIANTPALKQYIKRDRVFKGVEGKEIKSPDGTYPSAEISITKLKKSKKEIKRIQNQAKARIRELRNAQSVLINQARELDPKTSQGGIAELQQEASNLDGLIREHLKVVARAKKLEGKLAKADDRLKNIAIALAIKATGVGAIIIKIPFVERFIRNYGITVVRISLGIIFICCLFFFYMAYSLTHPNSSTVVQTIVDISGECDLGDSKCIGETYIKNGIKNGAPNTNNF